MTVEYFVYARRNSEMYQGEPSFNFYRKNPCGTGSFTHTCGDIDDSALRMFDDMKSLGLSLSTNGYSIINEVPKAIFEGGLKPVNPENLQPLTLEELSDLEMLISVYFSFSEE